MKDKIRLDLFLIYKNNIDSRNKAQEIIKNGFVIVNDKKIYKPNYLISPYDKVEILIYDQYVSRAANKLKHAIEYWKIDLKNKIVLDVGSSTGGFLEVCYKNKAKNLWNRGWGKSIK